MDADDLNIEQAHALLDEAKQYHHLIESAATTTQSEPEYFLTTDILTQRILGAQCLCALITSITGCIVRTRQAQAQATPLHGDESETSALVQEANQLAQEATGNTQKFIAYCQQLIRKNSSNTSSAWSGDFDPQV